VEKYVLVETNPGYCGALLIDVSYQLIQKEYLKFSGNPARLGFGYFRVNDTDAAASWFTIGRLVR
jgi:hypothetical protein